jgi:hypothetical protein
MLQSEYDALFFDQVYTDVSVKNELDMEGFALNYVLAEYGMMS